MNEVQRRLFRKMANILTVLAYHSNCNTGNAERYGGILWWNLHDLHRNVKAECEELGLKLDDPEKLIIRSLEVYDPEEAEEWKS